MVFALNASIKHIQESEIKREGGGVKIKDVYCVEMNERRRILFFSNTSYCEYIFFLRNSSIIAFESNFQNMLNGIVIRMDIG